MLAGHSSALINNSVTHYETFGDKGDGWRHCEAMVRNVGSEDGREIHFW